MFLPLKRREIGILMKNVIIKKLKYDLFETCITFRKLYWSRNCKWSLESKACVAATGLRGTQTPNLPSNDSRIICPGLEIQKMLMIMMKIHDSEVPIKHITYWFMTVKSQDLLYTRFSLRSYDIKLGSRLYTRWRFQSYWTATNSSVEIPLDPRNFYNILTLPKRLRNEKSLSFHFAEKGYNM